VAEGGKVGFQRRFRGWIGVIGILWGKKNGGGERRGPGGLVGGGFVGFVGVAGSVEG